MSFVQVLSVDHAPVNPEIFLGHYVETLKAGSESETYSLDIGGWVLGKDAPVAAVEIWCQDQFWRHAPLQTPRPDIQTGFHDAPGSLNSGFRTTASLLGLPANFVLEVRAVLRDERRVTICTITGRRPRLNSEPAIAQAPGALAPIMITALGRSGSTWLMGLLSQHPQIVIYRPMQYEPRAVAYWMEVLRALAEPASYSQILATDVTGRMWWLGKNLVLFAGACDPGIERFVGRDSVEALAAHCRGRVDGFYREAAAVESRPRAAYFAEKAAPDPFVSNVLEEIYPQSREIILVRDFRDMISSVFAYNAKRGVVSFGRQHAGNDVEYVWRVKKYAESMLRAWKNRPHKTHLVRYEQLIRQPVRTTQSMLEYLGLDRADVLVEEMLSKAAGLSPDAQRNHQTSADPAASIGRWRRDLPAALQEACTEALSEVMAEFGYDPDSDEIVAVSPPRPSNDEEISVIDPAGEALSAAEQSDDNNHAASPAAQEITMSQESDTSDVKSIYGRTWDHYAETWKSADGSHRWPGDEWGTAQMWDALYKQLFVPANVSQWQRAVEIGQGSGKYTLKVLEGSAATVRAYDVSAKFLKVCETRCADWINRSRLSLQVLEPGRADYLLDDLEVQGWRRNVDAFFSIDAMVHVDLQYLIVYLMTAALVLKPGGKLILTLADATSELGFRKLLEEVPWTFATQDWPVGTGKFEWLSPDLVRSILTRLGFTIDLLDNSGRDINVRASLVNVQVADRLRRHLKSAGPARQEEIKTGAEAAS
jgi:hypothetical protein